jgi:hypothetical protein
MRHVAHIVAAVLYITAGMLWMMDGQNDGQWALVALTGALAASTFAAKGPAKK